MPFMKNLGSTKKQTGLIDDVVSRVEFDAANLPGRFPVRGRDDKKLVGFYCKYKLWIFDYANALANGAGLDKLDEYHRASFVGNSGFAVLTLLNAYFDTIGQLAGNDAEDSFSKKDKNGNELKKSWANWDANPNNKPTNEQAVWFGLNFVFRDHLIECGINPATDAAWREACSTFYKQTRNGIAHIGFPGGTIIFIPQKNDKDPKYHQPLTWGRFKGKPTIVINWIEWNAYLHNHFEDYILRMRKASPNDPDWILRKRFLDRIGRIF